MWATLIQIVISRLQTALGESVAVGAVFDAEVPDSATVYVLRGGSIEPSLYGERGAETIIIECWVRDEDAAAADVALETLENNVIAALQTLPHSESVMSVAITSIDPDGDVFRPTVGSRINLTLSWRISPL